MIASWILVAVVSSLGLSIFAPLWDSAVEVAQKNENTRLLIRRILLLEATDRFTDQLVSFSEWVASTPSRFRAFLIENTGPSVVAGLAILEVPWFSHHILYHAETLELRLRDALAIVVGVVVFLVAVYRILVGSHTPKFRA